MEVNKAIRICRLIAEAHEENLSICFNGLIEKVIEKSDNEYDVDSVKKVLTEYLK